MLNLKIVKYSQDKLDEWDKFILNQNMSTIYHTRNFLSYHPKDRFIDESIMIYNYNILICVVPCCKKANEDKYFSHSGATYGGPVIHNKYLSIDRMKNIIDIIFDYYDNNIEFRIANNIYYNEYINKLHYLLNKNLKCQLELSWYVNTTDDFIQNIKNKSNRKCLLKMIDNNNLVCSSTTDINDYNAFYNMLKKNLNRKYATNPTHTLSEFLSLKKKLKDKQMLYLVKNKCPTTNNKTNNTIDNTELTNATNIMGGVYVIKVNNKCWYTFYISKNSDNNVDNLSIPYIMMEICKKAKEENVKYLDFGISTENKGSIMNIGLTKFKQDTLGCKSSFRYLYLIN